MARGSFLSLALTLAVGVGVGSVEGQARFDTSGAILDRIDKGLAKIDELLLAGDAAAAYTKAGQVAQRMVDSFISGPGVRGYLGKVTALRALAAYEIGEREEAIWHWDVAGLLLPEIRRLDLSVYGEAWEVLRRDPPPSAGDMSRGPDTFPPVGPEHRGSSVARPSVREKVEPDFPAARLGITPKVVVVGVMIGKDGIPRHPAIVDDAGEPTMAYAALEALRQWRFDPATLAGEPVETWYQLSVNFRTRGRE